MFEVTKDDIPLLRCRSYCTPVFFTCCNVHYRGTLEHLWNACRPMAATVLIPTVHRRRGAKIQDGRMWLAVVGTIWGYKPEIQARNPVIYTCRLITIESYTYIYVYIDLRIIYNTYICIYNIGVYDIYIYINLIIYIYTYIWSHFLHGL